MRRFEFVENKQLFNDFCETHEWLKTVNLSKYDHLRESRWSHSDKITLYIREHIIIPQRGTYKSAGYDIHSPFGFELLPGETIKFPTGLRVKMRDDEFLMIVPRSGSGFKYFGRLANTVGVIDADYYANPKNDGHIWVKLRNEGDKNWVVNSGEAVCQGIFMKYLLTDMDEPELERNGGLGSTGK